MGAVRRLVDVHRDRRVLRAERRRGGLQEADCVARRRRRRGRRVGEAARVPQADGDLGLRGAAGGAARRPGRAADGAAVAQGVCQPADRATRALPPGAVVRRPRRRQRTTPFCATGSTSWRLPSSGLQRRHDRRRDDLHARGLLPPRCDDGLPLGGSGAVVDALVRGVEKHGGRVALAPTVEELLVEDGRCVGVRLRNGTVVRARRAVRLERAGLEHGEVLPAELRRARARAATPARWTRARRRRRRSCTCTSASAPTG